MITVIGGFIGIYGVNQYVKKYNKQSIILVLLSIAIVIALVAAVFDYCLKFKL